MELRHHIFKKEKIFMSEVKEIFHEMGAA